MDNNVLLDGLRDDVELASPGVLASASSSNFDAASSSSGGGLGGGGDLAGVGGRDPLPLPDAGVWGDSGEAVGIGPRGGTTNKPASAKL